MSLLAGQDFKPISPPVYVFDMQGNAHPVYGWATFDGWANFHPVVANPDGPGIGPWRNYYGNDPWKAS